MERTGLQGMLANPKTIQPSPPQKGLYFEAGELFRGENVGISYVTNGKLNVLASDAPSQAELFATTKCLAVPVITEHDMPKLVECADKLQQVLETMLNYKTTFQGKVSRANGRRLEPVISEDHQWELWEDRMNYYVKTREYSLQQILDALQVVFTTTLGVYPELEVVGYGLVDWNHDSGLPIGPILRPSPEIKYIQGRHAVMRINEIPWQSRELRSWAKYIVPVAIIFHRWYAKECKLRKVDPCLTIKDMTAWIITYMWGNSSVSGITDSKLYAATGIIDAVLSRVGMGIAIAYEHSNFFKDLIGLSVLLSLLAERQPALMIDVSVYHADKANVWQARAAFAESMQHVANMPGLGSMTEPYLPSRRNASSDKFHIPVCMNLDPAADKTGKSTYDWMVKREKGPFQEVEVRNNESVTDLGSLDPNTVKFIRYIDVPDVRIHKYLDHDIPMLKFVFPDWRFAEALGEDAHPSKKRYQFEWFLRHFLNPKTFLADATQSWAIFQSPYLVQSHIPSVIPTPDGLIYMGENYIIQNVNTKDTMAVDPAPGMPLQDPAAVANQAVQVAVTSTRATKGMPDNQKKSLKSQRPVK